MVVSGEGVEHDPGVDPVVVGDPLCVLPGVTVEGIEQGDQILPQEELVVGGRAVDREQVGSAIESGIRHVDDGVAVARQKDDVVVGAGAAVEGEQRSDAVDGGVERIHADSVVAALAVDRCRAGDRVDEQQVVAAPGVDGGFSRVRRPDVEDVAA